jgi:hypothetical protein
MDPVDQLIAEHATPEMPTISAEAIDALRKIFHHNDNKHGRRITLNQTCAALAHYGVKCGRDGLRAICRKLGRKSFYEG